MNNRNELPDAQPSDQGGGAHPLTGAPPLELGDPFAIAYDCELLDVPLPAGSRGCTAALQCDGCGQKFKINLLDDTVKHCPRCNAAYTHCLLVTSRKDTDIVPAAIATVLRANGYDAPDPEGDEGDDGDDGEGQGDELADAQAPEHDERDNYRSGHNDGGFGPAR